MSEKKQIAELNFLDSISYHKEHTWAKIEGEQVKVGISDYAQDQLGDIIFIDLPDIGDAFDKGDVFGEAESAKTVSSLYMPVGGEIIEINENVIDSPENVNQDPYGEGWMVIIKPADLDEAKELLTNDEYISFLKELS